MLKTSREIAAYDYGGEGLPGTIGWGLFMQEPLVPGRPFTPFCWAVSWLLPG